MKFELVIANGPDAEQRFEITTEGELLLGWGEDCGVRLRDPSVSRHQCRIRLEADRVTLIGLSSRWSTLVNGRSIKRGELKSGDHITLGDTEIIVLLSSLADDTTLPPRTRPTFDQDPTDVFRRPLLAEVFSRSSNIAVTDNATSEPVGVSPRTKNRRGTSPGLTPLRSPRHWSLTLAR